MTTDDSTTRVCATNECGRTIARYNKSGLCQRCGCTAKNRSPEMRAKRSAAAKARWQDPAKREALVEAVTEGCRKPETRELRSRQAKDAGAGARLRQWGRDNPEKVRERARRARETRMAWCPPHLRDQVVLLSRYGVPADERRRFVEEHTERERIAVRMRFLKGGAD